MAEPTSETTGTLIGGAIAALGAILMIAKAWWNRDRVVNVLLGGIYKETLSSRAHRMRVKQHPYWGWTADAIDWLFFWELDHCAAQWRREVLMGWHD